MKVFIDTNILVSAVLYPNGIAAQAYRKAISDPYCGIISDYSISELSEVFSRKFSNRFSSLINFLVLALSSLKLVYTPENRDIDIPILRDKKDLPILQTALSCHADILLTGDKDFTDSGIQNPKIMTPFYAYKLRCIPKQES